MTSAASRFCAVLLTAATLALTGCTTMSSSGFTPLGMERSAGPALPLSETIGGGETVVGIVVGPDPGTLSDGASNSLHLAARLAATNSTSGAVRFEIRATDGRAASVGRAASELGALGASVVVAGLDANGTLALRNGLGNSAIPIITLARATVPQQAIYWAGFSPGEEAAALAAEAQRQGTTNLLVATANDPASRQLAAAIAAQTGLTVETFPVSATGDLARRLAASETQAAVCALTAVQCRAALASGNETGATPPAVLIGNAGWAMTAASPMPGPAWYPGLPATDLAQYRARFEAAYGIEPSLESALLYDLVILAGALPALVGTAPFAPEILTNPHGFTGFTGPFRFQASGLPAPRAYAIQILPEH